MLSRRWLVWNHAVGWTTATCGKRLAELVQQEPGGAEDVERDEEDHFKDLKADEEELHQDLVADIAAKLTIFVADDFYDEREEEDDSSSGGGSNDGYDDEGI